MTALLLCMLLAHTAAAADFGIGFNLNFDYATASVHYANGTSIGIAKLEGGSSYKRMMRDQVWDMPTQGSSHAQQDWMQRMDTSTSQTSLQDIRDHLPPWLGGRAPDERTQLIKHMLQSLSSAAKVFIQVDVHDTIIIFPGMPSLEVMEATKSATASAGLRLPAFSRSCAPSMAIYANRWASLGQGWIDDSDCHKWQERLVLAVDYSRATLTAVLYAEDCEGFLEGIRGFQDHDLGKGAARSKGDESGRIKVAEALRQLIRMPVTTETGNVLDHIYGLTLSGEAGYDEHLRSILKEVLRSEMANISAETVHDMFTVSDSMVEPLYASAMGSAAICWERLEERETTRRLELR